MKRSLRYGFPSNILGWDRCRRSYVVCTISTIIFEFIDLIKDYTDDGNDVANAKTFLYGCVYHIRFVTGL